MRVHVVLRYAGIIILLNAVLMAVSAVISLLNGADSALYPLILATLLTTMLGAFPLLFVNKGGDQINNKEGYAIVVGSWLLSCMVGMFPYLLWGGEFTLANAWFESVSGFTTTGATTLNDIEVLPKGLLFWRAATHWLGGVGVVMFVLVVMPSLGRNKLTLSSVEMSSLAKDNYRYKTQKIVQILLVVYLGMTLLETVMLRIAGMGWFDAVCHTFATVATGGFSTKNMSIAYFDNVWIEVIITIFMVLSGLHFGLIFATIMGQKRNIFNTEISKYYLGVFVFVSLIITFSIWAAGIYPTFLSAFRYATFQVGSIVTTTGFATADTNLWTPLAIILLMFCTIQCGCAGSTAGGLKTDRVWIALKTIKSQILQQQHPNAVITVKLDGVIQDKSTLNFVMLFTVAYIGLLLLGTVVFAALGVDLLTGFSMTATSMGNVGPGFGQIGSMSNYSQLSPVVKSFSTLFMLLGRLEIFGLLQLFLLKWWR